MNFKVQTTQIIIINVDDYGGIITHKTLQGHRCFTLISRRCLSHETLLIFTMLKIIHYMLSVIIMMKVKIMALTNNNNTESAVFKNKVLP